MENEINEKADQAIAKMFDQAKAQPDPQKALHYSQAALNMAHAKSVLEGIKSPQKKSPTDK
ncbi:MAG: hypothetical protein ACK5XN_22250 [Bacteroidota bacterium]|jgi:hypothetical protein